MPRTKIVCTLGPASDDPNILRRMLGAGMDVARLNCSHGDHTSHARRLAVVRRLAHEQERTLAVLCDLQGPKLRVGEIPGGTIDLPAGGQITLTTRSQPSVPGEIPLPHADLAAEISPGQRLLLDDGRLELRLEKKSRTELTCEVITGGELKSHQGIQAPGARLSHPALTDKDRSDVVFALEQGPLDYIAQSFVRRAADIEELRAFLTERGADVPIIAKIEKAEALEAFDEILRGGRRDHGRTRRSGDRDAGRAGAVAPEAHSARLSSAGEAFDHRHADAAIHDRQPTPDARRGQRCGQRRVGWHGCGHALG